MMQSSDYTIPENHTFKSDSIGQRGLEIRAADECFTLQIMDWILDDASTIKMKKGK